jgi:hypothetical protein
MAGTCFSSWKGASDWELFGLRARVSGTLTLERRTLRIVNHSGLSVLVRDPMASVVEEVIDS